jgi:RIO-like serine/threonine protein kinase
MDKVMFLIYGNHPKANTIKYRAIKIVRLLKNRDDWVDLNEIEKELEIDRNKSPSLFYKPLSAMKKWRLIDNKRQVTGQKGKSVVYTTYYKYTPKRFLSYLKDGLFSICETEIKMFK